MLNAIVISRGDMRLCTGIVFDTGAGPDLVERMLRVTEDLATCLHSILKTEMLEDRPRYIWIDQVRPQSQALYPFMEEAEPQDISEYRTYLDLSLSAETYMDYDY